MAKAVQAKNSHYQVQKVGLDAEACITSQTMTSLAGRAYVQSYDECKRCKS